MVFRAFVLGGNPQPKRFSLERLKSALAASLTLATALGDFVAPRPTAARSNDRRTPIAEPMGVIGEPCDFDHGFRELRAGACEERGATPFVEGRCQGRRRAATETERSPTM